MSKLNKYVELKSKVEAAQQKADKAEGALEQVMSRLDSEYNCSTLDSAQKKLTQLQKKEKVAKEEFDTAIEEFERNWPDELE